MTTTLSTPSGTINVANEQVHIVREADFDDFITLSPQAKKFEAVQALRDLVRQFGEKRTPMMDLYRARLRQLRSHLAS